VENTLAGSINKALGGFKICNVNLDRQIDTLACEYFQMETDLNSHSNSAAVTILFPIFASYKALRSSNPSQLVPWLEYWVVLSGILLVESWTLFIIGWYARKMKERAGVFGLFPTYHS
jgi:hypothetical protein